MAVVSLSCVCVLSPFYRRLGGVTLPALPVLFGSRAWTFSTRYPGTYFHVPASTGTTASTDSVHCSLRSVSIEDTDDRIDLNALRRPDPIIWSDAVTLFEDELGDNGAATYSVKIVGVCKHVVPAIADVNNLLEIPVGGYARNWDLMSCLLSRACHAGRE